MGGIDLLLVGDQIEAGDDDLVPPDARLARLVQLAVEAVGVGGAGHPRHPAVGGDAGDGVGREVGHVDVAVGIDGHAVGGFQVGRITGPLAVLLHRAVGVEGDFVHHPVAEVADVEVAPI